MKSILCKKHILHLGFALAISPTLAPCSTEKLCAEFKVSNLTVLETQFSNGLWRHAEGNFLCKFESVLTPFPHKYAWILSIGDKGTEKRKAILCQQKVDTASFVDSVPFLNSSDTICGVLVTNKLQKESLCQL